MLYAVLGCLMEKVEKYEAKSSAAFITAIQVLVYLATVTICRAITAPL
jgi:hypothetical protein